VLVLVLVLGAGAGAEEPQGCRAAGDGADDLRDFAGAEDGVDLRDLLPQLVAVSLGEAAGDDEAPAGAGRLVLRHLQDRVDRLLLRLVDERAGVDDDDIGRGRIVRQLVNPPVAARPSITSESDEVFRTKPR
jgi:hypothetical protein